MRHLVKVSVAQIAQEAGYEGINRSALDAMVDIVQKRVEEWGANAATSANLAGRTEVNYWDLRTGMASSLGHLVQFYERHGETPFPHDVPHLPRKHVILCQPEKSDSDDDHRDEPEPETEPSSEDGPKEASSATQESAVPAESESAVAAKLMPPPMLPPPSFAWRRPKLPVRRFDASMLALPPVPVSRYQLPKRVITYHSRYPHIPAFLPKFPSRRTYQYTPLRTNANLLQQRKDKIEQNRQVANAIIRMRQTAAAARASDDVDNPGFQHEFVARNYQLALVVD